jgi:hypothetical protein
VNKLVANVAGAVLTAMLCVGLYFLAQALPHRSKTGHWQVLWFWGSLIALIVVHEALHAAALIWFSKLPLRVFKFGVNWKALMPYCHCRVPVPIRAYRLMGMFPLYVTGTISLVALLLVPADWLAIVTGVTIGACIGDLWIIAGLWKFPGDVLVQDHPTEIGCDIYSAGKESANS